jgi:hypothetical protein
VRSEELIAATVSNRERVEETDVSCRTSGCLPLLNWCSRAIKKGSVSMQVLYERCAGLDVHKKTVVACILLTLANGQVSRQFRTFATTTAGLLALADWLATHQVTHVAMESTGVFWRPVFTI